MSAGVPDAPSSRVRALALRLVVLGLRATLVVSPRPTAWALRALFARRATDRGARAPADVVAVIDERYGAGPDALLDLYLPGEAARDGRALPVVVWTHGGAFVGGSKEEIGGYLRRVAHHGFAVVGLRYSLAPEATHPTPARQLLAALGHLRAHAGRLHLDPTRVVLAGDSAGAHISAQVAAVLTNPRYAAELGLAPTVDPATLRGIALCCGIYDVAWIDDPGPFKALFAGVGWAYSGTRHFRSNRSFMATVSLPGQVTADFPPAFVTGGNADPLSPQSVAFAATLAERGVDVETMFFATDHRPPLGHEYQFELALDDGRRALDRLVAFCRRCTGLPPGPPGG